MSRTIGTMMAALAVSAVAGAAGCSDPVKVTDRGLADVPDDVLEDGSSEAGDAAADPALDTPTDTPEVKDVPHDVGPKPFLSARKVAKKADLVGGPQAYGLVGRAFVLENSRARFLVQDADTAVHNFVHGGSLIDADIKRPAGQAGNDRWHETFQVVGGRVSTVDTVEVVKDGSDGQEAIVRTTGTDASTGIVPLLDNVASPLGVTIVTDYVLEPDVPWIRIRTQVHNPGDLTMDVPIVGDFLAFGGTERVFTPLGGFGETPKGPVAAVASAGDGVSYAYTVHAGEMSVPEIDVSGTVAFLGNDFSVPPKGAASFDRYLVVGDGDIASVMDAVRTLRNEEALVVSGTVRDEAGKPLPGAAVTFFRPGDAVEGAGKPAFEQAFSRKDGTFRARVPAGSYDLVASSPGRIRVVKTGVEASESAPVEIKVGAQGRIGFEVVEVDASEPPVVLGNVPAKAALVCVDAQGEWKELGEPRVEGGCGALFTATGQAAEYPVAPGTYRVVVSHGPEWEAATFDDVEVKAGETTWLRPAPDKPVALRRVVDTAGWVAADFHQHANGSLDTPVTPADHVVENLAEGVEVAALTDHDMISSYDPAVAALGAAARFKGLTGDEVSYNLVGHFNLVGPEGALIAANGGPGPLYDVVGSKLFAGRTIPEMVTAIRAIPGVGLLQINHPRSGAYAYLGWIRFDPVTGRWGKDVSADAPEEPIEWDFDAIEVKGSLGTVADYFPSSDPLISQFAASGAGGDSIPVMRDWFGWLNLGRAVAGTGNSDTSFPNEGSGWPRSLVRVGKIDLDKLATADLLAAVRAQKVVVSNGPFIRVLVGGKEKMGATEPVEPAGGKLVVRLQVQAPPWVDVSSLEVFGNGRPVSLVEIGGRLIHKDDAEEGELVTTPVPITNTTPTAIVRVDIDVDLFPAEDTWYVFLVRGKGDLAPAGRGEPYAYTNPLYVDVDGGGFVAPLE